jgi:hypothetical protein
MWLAWVPRRVSGLLQGCKVPLLHFAHRIRRIVSYRAVPRRTVPYRAASVFECDGVGSVRGAGWVMIEMYTYLPSGLREGVDE